MIPISILLPRQHFWSRRAIKTCAVDTLIGAKVGSGSWPLIRFHSPACYWWLHRGRQRGGVLGFLLVWQAHLLYISKPCILQLFFPTSPRYLLSCLKPFPSLILTSVAPPHHRSSAKAALYAVSLRSLIFCFPHKGSNSLTFYCFLFFFGGWCIKHGASGRGCWVGSHVPLNGQPCACA